MRREKASVSESREYSAWHLPCLKPLTSGHSQAPRVPCPGTEKAATSAFQLSGLALAWGSQVAI